MSNKNANLKRKAAGAAADEQQTIWEPENDLLRHLVLTAILRNNPIPVAYRLNYVANFFVGPLVKHMEETHKMTRPEWIVLFCLNQQAGLNAQQISNVTGRHKTSISTAVRQLQTEEADRPQHRRQGRAPPGSSRYRDGAEDLQVHSQQVRRARGRHDRMPRSRGAHRLDRDTRQDDRQQLKLGEALLISGFLPGRRRGYSAASAFCSVG